MLEVVLGKQWSSRLDGGRYDRSVVSGGGGGGAAESIYLVTAHG